MENSQSTRSGVDRRRIIWKGTTILGSKNRKGILVAADSLSWKVGELGISLEPNLRTEIKVHQIGGDPGYILLAIGGSNFMTDHVLVMLRNLVNTEHKEGRVLTSGKCGEEIHNFLNTNMKELDSKDYRIPKNADFDPFKCGVLVAMFEPDLKSVCADRRPSLYMADQEDYMPVDDFEIDGAGYNLAYKRMSADYDFDKEMQDAIVQAEEAMLEASTSGGSGGTILICKIDPNNHIEEVSRKTIVQLKKEREERNNQAEVRKASFNQV